MLMTRRLLRRLARDEDGVALVMALAIMMVLAITTTGILVAGTANQRTTFVSNEERQAFAIAQEGLAYAEGCIYVAAANNDAAPSCVSPENPPQAVPNESVGSGTYYASVAPDGVTWTMYGSGTVGGVTRNVSAVANIPSPVTSTQTGVWNYVYADASGSTCATTINGTVTISVPIMVRGDLCVSGSLNYTGVQLEVGGNLSVTGSAKLGSATKPVTTIKVGLTSTSTNTCTVGNNSPTMPGTGKCDGKGSPIYATNIGEGVDVTPSMPCIGQPSSYDPTCTGSNDGTWTTLKSVYNAQAALPKSGCPANLFDNNSSLDNSDTSISSAMFSSTAYDCKLGSASIPCTSSVTICEIKWTPSTNSLAVNGTFYFDGSLTIGGTVIYSGQASFYFTGTVGTNGSPTFCGASGTFGGSNCTTAWNPDSDGIVMIAGCWANSTGSTLVTTACVNLGGGANVQFGVYCTTQYTTAGGSSNMGPVLAETLNLGGSAQTLIPFHSFPPGTPENTTTTYLPASAPTFWSG
jgi:Tfp pilus assembly protein PilX